MNAEIKARWIAALRSGEYQQGTGRLRGQDNRYCCLGVLCDIAGGEWQPHGDSYEFWWDGEACDIGEVPEPLSGELGLSWAQGRLIEFNDDQKKSFDWIADWIEANL